MHVSSGHPEDHSREFTSPEAARNRLSENYDVQILDEEPTGVVLNIGKETNRCDHYFPLLFHIFNPLY